MKKYYTSLIVIGICLFTNINAQIENFDLSKYKLPDLERRTLETRFNFSNSINYTEKENENSSVNDFKLLDNSTNGNLNLTYYSYKNNVKFQKSSYARINVSSNFGNEKEDKIVKNKFRSFNGTLYYNAENRMYYKTNQFFEVDIDFDYNYSKSFSFNKSDEDDEYETDRLNHGFLINTPLKVGLGRIEPVTDARHAVYIFQELSKVDRISDDKSDEEIIELAEHISKIKNKRFFDSRIRKIEELEAIDSLFLSKGYLQIKDAAYFSTLQDIWSYGRNQYREQGTRLSFAIYPGYQIDYRDIEQNYTSITNVTYKIQTYSINGGVELTHEKPINLYWQNSISFDGNAGILFGKYYDNVMDEKSDINIPNLRFRFNHAISYYPNTRTDIKLNYSLLYAKLFDQTNIDSEVSGIKASEFNFRTGISINYYISPRLRVNASSSILVYLIDSDYNFDISFNNDVHNYIYIRRYGELIYQAEMPWNQKQYNYEFNISILYSIF